MCAHLQSEVTQTQMSSLHSWKETQEGSYMKNKFTQTYKEMSRSPNQYSLILIDYHKYHLLQPFAENYQ